MRPNRTELTSLNFSLVNRLLLKVCNTLRSKSNEVRVAAMETLTKITITLGIEYLPFIVKQLRGALKSGYQVRTIGIM